ncbi:hypothetical protein FRB93_008239 [Tulasnella sp. JGI-2019a]|nr:hypothetical protein FRB93_008239 [Tulasnella sp. JGI-2019a]
MEHMHGLYEILQKLDIRQIDDPDAGLIDCVLDPPQIKLRLGLNKQRVPTTSASRLVSSILIDLLRY